MNGTWEVVIGLEVHVQLATRTKLFTSVGYEFGAPANTCVDPFSLGMPGTLPVPCGRAIDLALRMALATECTIHRRSRFARKHYFYPDMPQGYQITQSDQPYATGGRVRFESGGREQEVRLVRIHLEGDAGKTTHDARAGESHVDFNRAGAPLIEIVSEPDLRSADAAADYLREVHRLVRWLGVSEANMERGSLRCDANVSLRRPGAENYGTRCEIKNLNSFKFMHSAIRAEVRRQRGLLDSGASVVQATMGYDADDDRTWVMRLKEDAADYLYFPDPDLPPLEIDDARITSAREAVGELPSERARRFVGLGVSAKDGGVLTADRGTADFFDAMLKAGAPAKKACNWLTGELFSSLNAAGTTVGRSPVSPEALARIVSLVDGGEISNRAAKAVFESCFAEGLEPDAVVARDGHAQVSDRAALREVLRSVMAANPAQLAQLRSGKDKLRGFFVGQVMKQTRGQANPAVVNELLDAVIAAEPPEAS